MSFMQHQIEHFSAYLCETTHGTEIVPCSLFTCTPETEDIAEFLEGELVTDEDGAMFEPVIGWYARLSAPGYLDCTDWSGPFTTADEAKLYLTEMYGDDDDEE